MRIACVIHDCNQEGGQERCAAELVNRLSPSHEVHLFAASARGIAADRVSFHRIRVPNRPVLLKSLLFFVQASAAIRRQSFDIVHAQGACMQGQHVTTTHFCEAAWLRKRRIVGEASGGGFRAIYHAVNSRLAILLERLVYQRGGTQAAIAVSKATRAELETRFGLDPARISVIYNGVDLDTFHPNRRGEWRDAIRRQVGIAEGVCLALFVGAFERKGLRYVLEALRLLHDTPVHLLVLGSGQGPGLIQAVRRLGVTDRVSFLGRQAGVQRYFAAADVFVLPTLYEPFGMSVLEAMACGLPVITSRTAGVAELIEDKVDGFLLDDPPDPAAIAQRVDEVLREPQLAAEMGRLARRRAEPYSWDYVVRETVAVYGRVLDEREAGA